MLQKLAIHNYAIIDHLVLEPDAHLNTVTGETGAGKSIILGALSLILGDRADTSVLINKDEKCVIEAYFDVKDNPDFRKALLAAELDDDTQCIIRREINASGKSRAFINDTPVTLNTLNELTSLLVDLQQQFGHLALQEDNFQMDVVDAVAQNMGLRKEYNTLYNNYRKLTQELSSLKQQQAQFQKEADYKKFLYDELELAAFNENEIEEAEQQLKQMAHAERILNTLQAARMVLEEGEQPLLNELKRVGQQMQSIADVMPEISALQERMASALAELKDIAGELEGLENKVNLDPALMLQLQERIDTGYKLLKKHALQNTSDLVTLQAQLANELKTSFDLDDRINVLVKETETVFNDVIAKAEKLSAARKKTIPQIVKRVNELLTLVGMPNAQIQIAQKKTEQPSATGTDEVHFLLDANKSGQFLPIHKAASGGEMSRIMLCIKSLTAEAMQLPTLIFDEVDTGISGEAAKQVGILLQQLGTHHQIICITHQPQVAAKGNRHFYVFKEAQKGRIITQVRILQPEERILAIARMIGGEQPGDAAMQHAKELVAM